MSTGIDSIVTIIFTIININLNINIFNININIIIIIINIFIIHNLVKKTYCLSIG